MCSQFVQVQEGDKADVDLAVAAARLAMNRKSTWRTMNPADRGQLLHKIADIIERNTAYIASLEVLDNGKPYVMAFLDVTTCVSWFR